jgi:hypothetical protein
LRRPNLVNVFIREFIVYSFMPELLGPVTAIDREGLSGNKGRTVGTEPHDGAGDFFRLAVAAAGNCAACLARETLVFR